MDIKQVREKIGYSESEFGRFMLRIQDNKAAYDRVAQLERQQHHLSTTDLAIRIMAKLVEWRDTAEPGCSKAMDKLCELAEKGKL